MVFDKKYLLRSLFAVALAASSILAAGQNTTGSIVGHVSDSTGAAVQNANVVITNTATSEVRETNTNSIGDYTVTLLKPGTYSISVSAATFKNSVLNGILLQVDQTIRADETLAIGSATDTVQVTADALTLDTESPSTGQVINEQQISSLPLNGRQFYDLIFLTPNAVQTGGEQGARTNSGGAISVGGARPSSNGYTVDGTSIMDMKFNTPAYNMSLDAIEEFKIQSKTYSAAYGYSVNQVTLSSKAGTNQFHGSLFEFVRNDLFDARNFFNRPPNKTTPLRQNEFGYSLGGPVWIPKIYNGHNKTFFFANYEGQRVRQQSTVQTNVPTQEQLQGKFTFPIVDPLTNIPVPIGTDGKYTIPASRMSRLGTLVASKPSFFYPAPNSTGTFNYVSGLSNPLDVDQQNYRLDQSFGPNDNLFVRATVMNLSTVTPGIMPVANLIDTQQARNYTLVYTHVFTSRLVNQFRFGYLEALAANLPYAISSADQTALAFNNALELSNQGYPSISFGVGTNPNAQMQYSGTGGTSNVPSVGNQPMGDLSDSVSWTVGKHNINFGFGMQRIQFDTKNNINAGGSVSFDGRFSGGQVADMLYGYFQSAGGMAPGPSVDPRVGSSVYLKFRNYAPYVQDDWKLSHSLTLNLGLRYEFHATPFEENNVFGWFTHNVLGGALYIADQKVATQLGNGYYIYNGKRGDGPAPRDAFAPRIGFAYQLFGRDKDVIRGGYGLFHDTIGLTETQGSTAFYPYVLDVSITQNAGAANVITTNGLFPSVSTGPITPATLQSALYLVMPEKYRVPYIQNWVLDIQHQLTSTTVLDVDYEGSKGTRLLQRISANQPHQCSISLGCNPATQTSATMQARRPFTNFGTVLEEQFTGWSNYNAMNIKLERRVPGLNFLMAYSLSKLLDDKSASAAVTGDQAGWFSVQNTYNPRGDYARASYDVGQRFVVSAVAEMPVGRGKRFMPNLNSIANTVIGGWQANAIYQVQKGFPFSIAGNDFTNVNESWAERANIIGNPYPAGFKKSINQWFNTSAFQNPQAGDFGNSSRNLLRAPGVNVLNCSLFKTFSILDRAHLETRFESFNTLNKAQFSTPDQNVNDANFGLISGTARDNRELQFGARLTF